MRSEGRRTPPLERATRAAVRWLIAALLLITALDQLGLVAQPLTLPNRPDSVKFAVIGDNGTGDQPEYDVAARMIAAHNILPFDMVMMLGDNLYGRQQPDDFIQKFARPYAPLLEMGVRFYAALGNSTGSRRRCSLRRRTGESATSITRCTRTGGATDRRWICTSRPSHVPAPPSTRVSFDESRIRDPSPSIRGRALSRGAPRRRRGPGLGQHSP